MNLYVMRHGRTNYNDLGLCNDAPNSDGHLTDVGKQQARAAAEQLSDIKLDRIIVSPLSRTRQTAEFVNQYHGAPIEVHPDITDIRSGFDGKTVGEYFAAIAHDPLNARVNGGESLRVFVVYFEGGVLDERLRDINIGNCEDRCYKLD